MNNNLITTGQLAKLAGTTKRTILWYARLGILKPAEISPEGYRFYQESQVLDYQKILLLTTLGVSLAEIKASGNLSHLFATKKQLITAQINQLQFNLQNLTKFMANLTKTGTMVNPKIITLKPFDVYYITKIGPYVKIGEYCRELRTMFANPGKNFTTLAIFENPTYQPKKSSIKIAALARPGMVIKPIYQNTIKKLTFNPGKVITYTHNGAGELLSLFWKELEKYCRLNKITIRHDIPDFEIYRSRQFFEIYLPIISPSFNGQ